MIKGHGNIKNGIRIKQMMIAAKINLVTCIYMHM